MLKANETSKIHAIHRLFLRWLGDTHLFWPLPRHSIVRETSGAFWFILSVPNPARFSLYPPGPQFLLSPRWELHKGRGGHNQTFFRIFFSLNSVLPSLISERPSRLWRERLCHVSPVSNYYRPYSRNRHPRSPLRFVVNVVPFNPPLKRVPDPTPSPDVRPVSQYWNALRRLRHRNE